MPPAIKQSVSFVIMRIFSSTARLLKLLIIVFRVDKVQCIHLISYGQTNLRVFGYNF